MLVGAIIPNAGTEPGELGITAMGHAAEAAGASTLWVSDHLLQLDTDVTGYPYSHDGRPTWDSSVDYYEALTCCSFLAAATRDCYIGTAILIAPQRNVLELAKTAATIDQLSNGRLILGLGAGWHEQEMSALGYSFKERGKRFDEMLKVLRSAWTGTPKAFRGDHVKVPPGVLLHPPPAQSSGPPMLVGGMTTPAIRRVAHHGDGWLAIAWVERLNLEDLAEKLDKLREQWSAAKRKGSPRLVLKLHSDPAVAKDTPDAIRKVAELGFDEVAVEPPWHEGLDVGSDFIRTAVLAGSGMSHRQTPQRDRS